MTFQFAGGEYAALPVKVDRKKLYGWSEIAALDEEGRECKVVTMDESGTFVIPRGGLGMGMLSPDGLWVERSSLKAIKPDGSDAELIPSSYSVPVKLQDTIDADEFYNYNITSVYELTEAPRELIEAVGDKIYTFTYSYRDAYAGSSAFVLAAQGVLFLLAGFRSEYELLAMTEAGAIDETEDDDEEAIPDELDFA
jgi:hypothetical protein